MSLLYLITHAHTRPDPEEAATRWRLSTLGEEQAAALARAPFWAQVDRLLLSREPKARLTVAPLLAHYSLPVTVDARFDELARGKAWIPDYAARVAHAFAHPSQSAGGWEPAAQALARFLDGVADARQRFPGQTLALVGHGLTLSLYRAHLLGQARVRMEDWQHLAFASVARVDLEHGVLEMDFRPVAGVPNTRRG